MQTVRVEKIVRKKVFSKSRFDNTVNDFDMRDRLETGQ